MSGVELGLCAERNENRIISEYVERICIDYYFPIRAQATNTVTDKLQRLLTSK